MAVHDHLAVTVARCPVAHFVPEVECKGVTHHGYVVEGGKQHPVVIGRHAKQFNVVSLALGGDGLESKALLVKE